MKHDRTNRIPWEFQCLATINQNLLRPLPSPEDGGAKSLQDLCMGKIVAQSRHLKPETLENLPHAIAIRIWTAIRRQWHESFHVWKAFVEAGFKKRTFNHHLEVKSWYSLFPLVETFEKLSSRTCSWVVNLTLANFTASATYIKEVSRIANLQNLHVQYSHRAESLNFDDRILEAWANRAADEGAFGRLESVSVVNAPAITSDVFQHLVKFPVLTAFIRAGGVQFGRKDFEKGNQHGWIRFEAGTRTHVKSSYESQAKTMSRIDGLPAAKGPKKAKEFVQSRRPRNTESELIVPRLDAQLGSLESKGKFDQPGSMSCFQRDPNFVARKVEEHNSDEHAGPRKRRRLGEAKSADFASMLDGD